MIGDIKAALDILKSIKDFFSSSSAAPHQSTQALGAQFVELQKLLIATQQDQSALTQRISELEKNIAQLEDWGEEKKRYKLRMVGIDGQMPVYIFFDKFVQQGEAPHEICAACYNNGEKSILSRTPADPLESKQPARLLLTCPVHDVTMISVHPNQLLPPNS